MRRPWQIWSVFAACLLVVAAAVGWLSFRALESEGAERTALAQAALEENARLALWRLDSSIAPLIAQENANPVSAFQSVNAREREISVKDFTLFTLSPLFSTHDPQIKLHFEIDSGGEIDSPEVPPADRARLLALSLLGQQQLDENRKRLAELQKVLDWHTLTVLLRASTDVAAVLPTPLASPDPPEFQYNQQDQYQSQTARNDAEFQVRRQAISSNNAVVLLPGGAKRGLIAPLMTPLWIGDRLLLVRQVIAGGNERLQGCWLDWPVIRDQLTASVRDLLPQARLEPAQPDDYDKLSHRMAALPVTLITGKLPSTSAVGLSPVRLSLAITWVSLAVAALAAAVLLRGVLALSERRAAFVSAVTHELRTPLTTFRMYAEMLAEGMVTGEADRHSYLQTLHAEAGRLSHLVENVLAYARLERGGPGARIGPVPVGELLDRAGERLSARAATAGFVVERSVPAEVLAARAVADPAAVEQILFNLVDNACKYAQSAADRRLWLDASLAGPRVQIRLRDSGPGIGRLEQRRLFQPFRKSARDAAQSAPGVGLGLALCRRLARDMGGELSLDDASSAGACFVLTLKAVVN